jgi:tRNA (guanine-N7-)-methyltransferase
VKRRVRHHRNPLNSSFLERQAERLEIPERMPVEVELGCADARFLFERAPRHPETLFVGLEIREPLVDQVNEQARALGLPNLRACFAHVNVDLDALFADGRLARVYVNFPDPWFKRRHRKRRVMNEELAEVLFRKLAPSGELFFQSDIWDLALDAMAVLEASSFRNRLGPWSFARQNPYEARSLREVRCEERDLRIWRMRYDRPA